MPVECGPDIVETQMEMKIQMKRDLVKIQMCLICNF